MGDVHLLTGKGRPAQVLPLSWVAQAIRSTADRLEKRDGRNEETIRLRWLAAQVDEHERSDNASR